MTLFLVLLNPVRVLPSVAPSLLGEATNPFWLTRLDLHPSVATYIQVNRCPKQRRSKQRTEFREGV